MHEIKFVRLLRVIAIICVFISLLIFGLWIHACSLANTQAGRVALFIKHFPSFLRTPGAITTLSIFLDLIGVILIMVVIHKSSRRKNIINFALMALGLFMLALNLFSLM